MSNRFVNNVLLNATDGALVFEDAATEIELQRIFFYPIDPNGLVSAPAGSLAVGPAGTFFALGGLVWTAYVAGPVGPVFDNVFKILDNTDPTRYIDFDVQGTTGTHGTFLSAPTVNQVWTLPDFTGNLLLAIQTAGANFGIVFINQTAKDHGSNAGIQFTTSVANRAQFRGNQYGPNAGIPGMTAFKSRGPEGGPDLPVIVGDVIWRATAIGITDNLSFPLSGTVSVVVESVPAGQGYVGTGYEVGLVPDTGPANGRVQAFYVSGNGIVRYKEQANGMAGVATTGAGGTILVANTQIKANSRIMLTLQDGGVVPTAAVYVSARVVGVSFTIQSLAAGDVGCKVYYQIFEPTT
jgi:hypothetical protein